MERLEKYLEYFTNYSELTTELLFTSNRLEIVYLLERLILNNKVFKITFERRKKYSGLVGSSLKTFWFKFEIRCESCDKLNNIIMPLSSYKYDVYTFNNNQCDRCHNKIKLK